MVILLVMCSFLYCEQADDQSSITIKEEIVVTASKTDVSLKDVSRSVIIITKEDIERANTTDLVDIIKEKAGIHIAQNGAGPGSNSSLFVRGANSNYNLILLDGVPLNMPGGDYDLGDLALDGVERIEIVKGSMSVLYGPYAAASVINIITNKSKETSARIGFSMGNYSTFHEVAELNLNRDKYQFHLYGSRLDSDRQLEINNKYYRTLMGMKMDYAISEKSSFDFNVRWNDAKDNYPTGSAGDRFITLDLYDPDQYIKNNELLLSSQYSTYISNWQSIFRFSYTRLKLNYYDADSGILIDPFGEYYGTDTSSRYIAELQNNINYRNHLVSLGIEYQRELFDSIDNYSTESFKGNRNNLGIYLQDQWHNADEKLFVTSGIRLDKNSNYKAAFTPQLSMSYKIFSGGTIKSSLGLGFKAPSFWQTLGSAYITGNPNLKPEKAISYDLSLEYINNDYEFKIAPVLFVNKFYDLIEYEPHFDSDEPDYNNVGSAFSYGIELEMEKALPAGFSLKLASAYTVARKDDVNGTEIEKLLLRRPKYNANISIQYMREKLTSEMSMVYVGKRVDLDFSKSMYLAERVWAPSYYLVNISASYEVYKNMKLNIRVENLLNRKYEEVYGFSAKKRVVLLGIEVGWK
jgi:vitamin B12 transporter